MSGTWLLTGKMYQISWIPLIFAIATAQQCGKPAIAPKESRIVGGEVAIKNSWPWQIHLGYTSSFLGLFESTQFICGGSIIGNKWIVTAAHCVANDLTASKYTVRVGQHDSSVSESTAKDYKVKRIIKHSSYNTNNMDNDIALLELSTSITYSTAVSPVCLPGVESDPSSGTQVITTGWGETSAYGKVEGSPVVRAVPNRAVSRLLRQVKLNIVSRTNCNARDYYNGQILNSMVCAGITGKDACQGDSGGPLVAKNAAGTYELVGVVSWGEGCGAVKRPGVFSRVGKFVSWIKQNTGL